MKPLLYLSMLLFLFSFQSPDVKAQDEDPNGLLVKGIVTHEGSRVKGADVLVYDRQNRVIEIQRSERDGSFEVHLSLDGYYVVEFRMDGMASKRLLFRTHTPDHEKSYHPFDLEIAMFEKEKALRNSKVDMDLPLGIVEYFPEKGDFDYVKKYTIERLKEQAELLSKES